MAGIIIGCTIFIFFIGSIVFMRIYTEGYCMNDLWFVLAIVCTVINVILVVNVAAMETDGDEPERVELFRAENV